MRRQGLGRRVAAVAVVAVAAVAIVAVAALAAWRPWAGPQGAGEPGLGGPASPSAPATQAGAEGEGYGGDWVLDMFRDLPPMVGMGGYEAWEEAGPGEAWDFEVEQPSGGASARFAFSGEYRAMCGETGTECTAAGFVETTNRGMGSAGCEPAFSPAEGRGAWSLRDRGGEAVAYADTPPLRDLASAARAYRASWAGPQGQLPAGASGEAPSGTFSVGGRTYWAGKAHADFPIDTPDELIREVAGEAGCKVASIYDFEEFGVKMVSLTVEPGREETAVEALRSRPEVSNAELSTYVSVDDASSAPAAKKASSVDSFLQYYLRYSRFEEAWGTSRCEHEVAIGVVDTGIDWENTELRANVDLERMCNAVEGTRGPAARMRDEMALEGGGVGTHGTHVAAVASAVAGDGFGCDGASFNATLIPVKVTDSNGGMDRDSVIEGYRYLVDLDDPPDVINLSFSTHYASKEDAWSDSYVQAFQALVDRAWRKGIVTVASSGNDGAAPPEGDVRGDAGNPVNGYSYPACLDHVVSVGALADPGWGAGEQSHVPRLAGFSNTTSDVNIAAYGENVHITNAYHNGAGEVTDWFTNVSGTSFSAPQVAAAAALVKRAHPGYTAAEVVAALERTAARVGEADSSKPRGGFGAGALDAAAALGWRPPSGYVPPGTGGSFWETARGMDERRGE